MKVGGIHVAEYKFFILSYLRNAVRMRGNMVVAVSKRKINPKVMMIIRVQNMKDSN